MPLHTYCCREHGEFDAWRPMADNDLQLDHCPVCSELSQKVWRADTIGSFDRNSASAQEPYYNEQLDRMVRKGREHEEIARMNDRFEATSKPVRLDWR